MGIDLILRCDDREFCTRPSMAEWDMIASLRAFLPDPVTLIVGDDQAEMGDDETFTAVALLGAIESIDDFLVSQSRLLPVTYVFKREYLLLNGSRFPIDDDFSTGAMSGIEFPGDTEHRYSIRAGVEECHLSKIAIDPDGRGRIVEQRDLRSEEEIETTTCGRIQIRKRNDQGGLRGVLAQIREFLESSSGELVTRTISG
ncbi:hypothetical protein ACYOEI_14055 [Singulisphaera rosea]